MKVADGIRGALAGALGGVVGGALKLACEAIVPPRGPGREAPPGILAADVARAVGRELTDEQKERAAMTMHWVFSAVSGALHGVAVEANPALGKRGDGVPFGLAIWVGFHEIALPVLRATPPLARLPIAEQMNECITHAMFGACVERTRRAVRPLFEPLTL